MQLVCESNKFDDYLLELDVVDYSYPLIREKVEALFTYSLNEMDMIKTAYEFVRDNIAHSYDIQSSRVTCKASEVLYFREGICYAKSHLLAAILRSKGIPTGFCYQRLTLGDTPEDGYCIHALNAVYLRSLGRWIRLDARGNKPGVDAQFSVDKEQLAFPVRKEYDEEDYPVIYVRPNVNTVNTLEQNTDSMHMYFHLPTRL